MGAMEVVEQSQLAERPAMKSGDTVRVHVKVREGDKERIQFFEGVVLDPARHIAWVSDSKAVPAAEREELFAQITRHALGWAVASADPREIDHINIHQASLTAMRRAVLALAPLPDIVLVDAFRIPDLTMAQRGVRHGDRRCAAIAAASIVAKVTRDREMLALHGRDPRYGFDRHKGYATADHLDAVARFGYSDAHRRSFRPQTLFDTIE